MSNPNDYADFISIQNKENNWKEPKEKAPVVEAKEPPQSMFDSNKIYKQLEKEINLLKAWVKYYKSSDGKKEYNNAADMAKDSQGAIVALEKMIRGIEDYEAAMHIW